MYIFYYFYLFSYETILYFYFTFVKFTKVRKTAISLMFIKLIYLFNVFCSLFLLYWKGTEPWPQNRGTYQTVIFVYLYTPNNH